MNAQDISPNTCPLCRQRALLLDSAQISCTSCGAKAEFDNATKRIRYTRIPEKYARLETELSNQWLARRAVFALTEPKPLPTIVFFPVLISLFALCALFGLIGVALAVRPSASSTKQLIDDAYAQQNSGGGLTDPISPTLELTSTQVISVSAPLTNTQPDVSAANQITQPVAPAQPEQLPATPTVAVAAPTTEPLTTEPPTPLPPNIPTRPPTFTPVPSPTQLPTAPPALAQTSPLPTPALPTPTPQLVATTAATATIAPVIPTATLPVTATSLAPTATSAVTNTRGSTLITGSVAISDVHFVGDTAMIERDEYVDVFNQSVTTTVNLRDYKIRVGGANGAVYFINPQGVQIQVLPRASCRIYTGIPNLKPRPAEFGQCGDLGLNANNGVYPNTAGVPTLIELLDANGVLVAQFTY